MAEREELAAAAPVVTRNTNNSVQAPVSIQVTAAVAYETGL